MEQFVKEEILESIYVKQKVMENCIYDIIEASEMIVESLRNGNKIFFCGNGGSSMDASHIAAELVVRFKPMNNRKSIAAISLNADSAVITACGNDYGYDKIFERQLEGLGQKGDVLVAITTSGNSPNINCAVEKAKEMNIKTIALLGGTGGKLKGKTNVEILVPSTTTGRIQESHIMIGHIICSLIEKSMFGL